MPSSSNLASISDCDTNIGFDTFFPGVGSMSTSVYELKKRLRKFLSDPSAEEDFRAWFAYALRDAHKSGDAEFENLVHSVQVTFVEAAEGNLADHELRETLENIAGESKEPRAVYMFVLPPEKSEEPSEHYEVYATDDSGQLVRS